MKKFVEVDLAVGVFASFVYCGYHLFDEVGVVGEAETYHWVLEFLEADLAASVRIERVEALS